MARLNVTSYFKKLLLQFVTEPDPLLAMLQWLTQQLMQLEAESKVGAQKNKHSRERSTYFSGYRIRRFGTRLGTLYLMVPKLRNGGYVPFFVVERKRSEQALIQVVQEAFINGVSTRKIERLAKALGIETLSASQVSEINEGDLDWPAFLSACVDSGDCLWFIVEIENPRMDNLEAARRCLENLKAFLDRSGCQSGFSDSVDFNKIALE